VELAACLDGTDALVALDAAHDAAWGACDPELLALCRDRAAMLLRHQPTMDAMSDDRRAAVRGWLTDEHSSALERAALAFTEQYVIDVASLTDDQAGELHRHLGDEGLVTFVNALLVVEQRMTLELAFEGVL
jgi:alkylhydroperoxidase family enzyme